MWLAAAMRLRRWAFEADAEFQCLARGGGRSIFELFSDDHKSYARILR